MTLHPTPPTPVRPTPPTAHPAAPAGAGAGLPTLALCYTRVSSDDQEREGVSLPAQVGTVRRYAAERGLVVHREYQDVLSGTKDARPGYQALLADVRRLVAEGRRVVVVVARLDRFGRRLLERVRSREEFRVLGVPTHSVTEGGEVSDLQANILAAVAEEEVRTLGQRVSAAVRHTRGQGWPSASAAPWGYVRRPSTPEERRLGAFQATLDVAPEEAPFVAEAFERAARGESLHSLSRWAAALPPEARGGRALAYSNLRLALHSPVYVARQPLPKRQRSRTTLVDPAAVLAQPPGHWPALVTDAVWLAAQRAVADHRRVPKQARGAYLLTGLVRCPACGGRLAGATVRNPGKARPGVPGVPDGTRPVYATRRYVCPAAKRGGDPAARACRYGCHADSLEASALAQVGTLLEALTADPARRREVERRYDARRRPEARGDATAATAAKQLAQLDARAARVTAAMTGATEKYALDKLTEAQYQGLVTKLESDLRALGAERAALTAALAAATGGPDAHGGPLPPYQEAMALADGWRGALAALVATRTGAAAGSPESPEAREARAALRAVLTALVARVTPVKRGYARVDAALDLTPWGDTLRRLAQPTAGG